MIKFKKLKNYITLLILVFALFFITTKVFAASIFINSDNNEFAQGEEFLISLFLDTESKSLNAVEGKILFSDQLLEIKEIRDGNSAINFWIEKPHITEANTITFSGITPGGLLGSKELLFSVVMGTKSEGAGVIKPNKFRILQNDGKGTEVSVVVSDFKFTILKQIKNLSFQTPLDIESPEDFQPFVARDANLFDGQSFVVFLTQDKISGIDHYEVREGFFESFVVAESPYLLKDQSLSKSIYIKAIDKSGNERLVKIKAQNPDFAWLKLSLIFGILIIIYIFISRKIWLKFRN